MDLTPAMQKIILWYIFGVGILLVYGLFRLREFGGLGIAIRSPRMWRGLGLLVLCVLAAPIVVMIGGALLFMIYALVTGTSIR